MVPPLYCVLHLQIFCLIFFQDLNLPGRIFFLLINSLLLFLSSLNCLSELSCSLNFFMITILNSLSDHIPCLTIGFWRTAIFFFHTILLWIFMELEKSFLYWPYCNSECLFFLSNFFFNLIVMIQWVGNQLFFYCFPVSGMIAQNFVFSYVCSLQLYLRGGTFHPPSH